MKKKNSEKLKRTKFIPLIIIKLKFNDDGIAFPKR